MDTDELTADLDELMEDFPQVADILSPTAGEVSRGVKIILGDVRREGSTNRAAWRDEETTAVVVKVSDVGFRPDPGTLILTEDGLRLRVTDCTYVPGDVTYLLTVENRSKT